MTFNAKNEYGKLIRHTNKYYEQYKKLGMSPQAIEQLVKFDFDIYRSDRKYYEHLSDSADTDMEELCEMIPTYDVYYFENPTLLDSIRDSRLIRIIKCANKKEIEILSLIAAGYSYEDISMKMKISRPRLSRMIKKLKCSALPTTGC